MFIGENTIRQLKEVFMEELKEIFPEVMAAYTNDITQQKSFGEAIARKIKSVQIPELKDVLRVSIGHNLCHIGYIGALTGFMFGVFQVLLMVFAGNL